MAYATSLEHRRRVAVAANGSIVAVVTLAVLIVIESFLPLPQLEQFIYSTIAVGRFIQRLAAVLLLVVAWNLTQRKRFAWILCVGALTISMATAFIPNHPYVVFRVVIVFLQCLVLVALLYAQDYFRRPSDTISTRRAGVLAIVAAILVFANTVFARFTSSSVVSAETLRSSLGTTVSILSGEFTGRIPIFEWFVFLAFWVCIALSIALVLRSAFTQRRSSAQDRIRARNLVQRYGQNPGSYLALETDKALFFGQEVDGVIAYGVVGGVVVVNGDPICAQSDVVHLLAEFQAFCRECSYECVFLGTTGEFLDDYARLGFSYVKAGEEARFKLAEYHLKGNKRAKMRAAVNHANAAGLVTHEYVPALGRDPGIEDEIVAVSRKWLAGKKSGELAFMVGTLGLDDPMDRRYFYARNADGALVAFNVFLPFASMNGYLVDMTRRLPEAPSGATEKITFDAFMTFKEEGIEWGSLGLSPLANVRESGDNDDVASNVLELVYDRGNKFYGFQNLHRAKKRYSPTSWEPGYFVYSSRSLTPRIAYAIVAIQNPGGIRDYFARAFGAQA